ncbi:GNAT family N-acetyltransferase [bacterium]|nr:MAG: GNAT family N-acetyltransferase [bacterium]
MRDIHCKILDSINKITIKEWDSIFGDLPEGYQFYKTLEESRLEGFHFYYLVIYDQQVILLIAPLFITDFNLDIAAEGFIEKIIRHIRKYFPRFLILKTLFCGSPFTEHGVLGIRNPVDNNLGGPMTRSKVFGMMVDEIYRFCRKEHISLIVFKDFLKEDTCFLDNLKLNGFFRVNSFPSVANELNFDSFEGYLSSLSSPTRKNLRRKIKNAYSQALISVEIIDDCRDIVDDIIRLYENTYHSGAIQFEKLTRSFFINIGNNLKPNAKFFLYYVNRKLAAFNLCFAYRDLLIDKFIGFDYDLSKRYNLYFISWAFNIDWCIKNSVRYYHTGQTDYRPKLQLGGKLIPLYAYLRYKNRLVNLVLKLIARFLSPENFDGQIRDNIND